MNFFQASGKLASVPRFFQFPDRFKGGRIEKWKVGNYISIGYISDLENKCIDNHYYTLYTYRTNALSFLYLHTQI